MPGKDAGFRIRVERKLRDEFLETCRSQDRPAAQVLREFMREYVASHPSDLGDATVTGAEATKRKLDRGSKTQ